MYYYDYCVMFPNLSGCWETQKIESFLRGYNILEERGGGIFVSRTPFLDISLMKVKSPNSWNSLNYDSDETNYISITTSSLHWDIPIVNELFLGLEELLGEKICFDE